MGPAGPAAGHGKLKSLTDTEIRSITTIINDKFVIHPQHGEHKVLGTG